MSDADAEMFWMAHGCYSEPTQLSFSQNNGYTHLILRPDKLEERVVWDVALTVPGPTVIWYVPTAAVLLQRFWETMNYIAELPQACIVAGWQLRNIVWPKLVTLGLRYGIRIHPSFRTDPLSRYSTIKTLLDVNEIYMQGAYNGNGRKVPDVREALLYFGAPQVCPVSGTPYGTPESHRAYGPESWYDAGHLQVINILSGMQHIVKQYYNAY